MKLQIILVGAIGCLTHVAAQEQEQTVLRNEPRQPVMNVAVIGAGAGGASTAYHLSKFAANASLPVNITVFERKSYIGGRSTTVNAYDDPSIPVGRSTTVNAYDDPSIPVELGASIFVEVNSILVNAVKEFNLSTTPFNPKIPVPGAALAIWDGQKIVLNQEGEMSWFDKAKLIWRYGLAPIKTVRLVKSVIGKFLKMYDEPHFPFKSLTQVAQDVGLLTITSATGEQFMEENGITGAFGREIVQCSTRVNYAQNLVHIHALEAMVSMAADDAQSVTGGNWQIFERMIAAGDATTVLDTKVRSVERRDDGAYQVSFCGDEDTSANRDASQDFDAVVLAAPHQFSDIKLVDLSPDEVPDEIPYVELHVTLLTSPHLLSPQFFNLAADKAAPRVILTTLPKDEKPSKGPEGVGSPGFFSVSLLQPVINTKTEEREYLYKVFSPSPPNATFLSRLLAFELDDDKVGDTDITWMYRKVWQSYPYEYPRVTFDNIQLSENLWYTGGMDSFISTMETNALMGRNVARLVVDAWQRRSGVNSGYEFIQDPGIML